MSAGQLRTPEIGCADAFSGCLDIAAASRADASMSPDRMAMATQRDPEATKPRFRVVREIKRQVSPGPKKPLPEAYRAVSVRLD